jgi:hypothetical protein
MSFISRTLNLILPGLGNAINGQYRAALIASAALMILFVAGVGLAWVETRTGWLALLAGYITLGALSSLGGLASRPTMPRAVKATAIYFSSLALIGTAVFYVQPHLTGYSIYLIPSDSMAPTIEPGDIVLVKEVKRDESPQIGQVVVFVDAPDSSTHYIKRVAPKPFALRQSGKDQYFMLGDNAEHSLDSRYIGLVDRTRINEVAKIILFSISDKSRITLELKVK